MVKWLILFLLALLIGCGETAPDPTVIPPTDMPSTATSLPPSTPTLVSTSEPESTAVPIPTKEEEDVATESPTEQPTQSPTDAPTEAPTLTPEPTEPAVSNSGYGCFGTDGAGLVCLTAEGAWQRFDESEFVSDLAACPDGTILAAGFDLLRYDGVSLRPIDADGQFFAPDAVACGDETVWVGHFEGVSALQHGTWTTYGIENIYSDPAGAGLITDIALDSAGNVWVLSANSVAMFDGGWTEYSELKSNLGENYLLNQLFFVDDLPWAATNNGLLQFDENRWIEHKSPDFEVLESAAVDPSGVVYATTFSEGVLRFDGGEWSRLTILNSQLSDNGVRSIAADEAGRLYLGTAFGLNVRSGREWVVYDMDSAELPANEITSIAVVEDGPTLPPLLNKTDGAVLGRIESAEGAALAETRVQLCVRELYSVYFGETPCSDQARYFSILTNKDGDFLFEDVPVGIYYIVYLIEGDWVKLTDEGGFGSEEILVSEGETVDVGVLTLDE